MKKLKLFNILLLAFILIFPISSTLAEEEDHIDKHLLHRASELARTFEGITFGLGLTGVLQGTLNMDDLDPATGNKSDFAGSFDIELQKEFEEKGTIFMLIEAGAGDGLTDEAPFDALLLGGVNDDAGSTDNFLEITEAWYEAYLRGGQVIITAGKVNMSAYFDSNEVANDETAQFLATTFVNNPAIEFPDNGFGGRVTVKVNDNIALSLGLAEGDADFEDIFSDVFFMIEVDVSAELMAGKGGNYRLFYWINGTDHQHLTQPALTREDGYGFGLSVDQKITDILSAFARFGLQNADVYEVEAALSFGVQAAGFIPGREDDVFGLAYAHGLSNSDIPALDDEGHLELYYSFAVNEHVAVTPDIQMVINPGGDSTLDAAIVFGLRTQVIF